MSQQLLDGADVVPILQQVGREGMPKCMTGGGFRNPRSPNGFLHGPLQYALVEMVAAPLARDPIHIETRRR